RPGILGAAAVALLLPAAASAYQRSTTGDSGCPAPAVPLVWTSVPISYVLDSAGSADLPLQSTVDAVNASFQTWQDVACSRVAFNYGGTVGDGSQGNLVKWAETDWGGDSNTYAITTVMFSCDGRILGADIEVNGQDFVWTVGASSTKAD